MYTLGSSDSSFHLHLNALSRLQQKEPVKKPTSTTATWKHKTESQGGATAIDYEHMKKDLTAQTTGQHQSTQHHPRQDDSIAVKSNTLAVDGVTFLCPICPASLPKPDIYNHLANCLKNELDAEPLMISVTMIHTLNRDRSAVENCIHVLGKYLQNIIDHQDEEKYRKIRKTNKVFSEKVGCLAGVPEFLLKGVGFHLETLPFAINGETSDHDFYVLDENLGKDQEQLVAAKQMLMDAEPLEISLDRNLKVFEPSSSGNRIEVPESFYSVTSSELKREQTNRSDEIEKSKQLRTKAMREADNGTNKLGNRVNYKHTVLRIRFPDGVLLQGTFSSSESINDVKNFVRENLMLDWLPFSINDAIGRAYSSETASLSSLKLTPAALVTFVIDDTVKADIASSSPDGKLQFLKNEALILMQTLTV